MTLKIDKSYYEAYIFHKISTNSLDNDKFNFLFSLQGDDNITHVLDELKLKQEFISFQNQKIKEKQDAQYHKSILMDKVRHNELQQATLKDQLMKLQFQLDPLEKEYKNWYARHLQFPENPRFTALVEQKKNETQPIRDKMLPILNSLHVLEANILPILNDLHVLEETLRAKKNTM